jgi:CTP:molybdopterin cytidylyltransferase MocA
LLRYAAHGNFSPRRIMTEENAALLHLPNGSAAALVNINTPQDMEARDHVGR